MTLACFKPPEMIILHGTWQISFSLLQPLSAGAAAAVSVPPSSHHLCCTIELRSFKDLDSPKTKNQLLFLRYLYPFFGFNEPIHTFPATRVSFYA